jgi:hypothetical protein
MVPVLRHKYKVPGTSLLVQILGYLNRTVRGISTKYLHLYKYLLLFYRVYVYSITCTEARVLGYARQNRQRQKSYSLKRHLCKQMLYAGSSQWAVFRRYIFFMPMIALKKYLTKTSMFVINMYFTLLIYLNKEKGIIFYF